MSYFEDLIRSRRMASLQWPTHQVQAVNPLEQSEGGVQPPPKPQETQPPPNPSSPDMKNAASRMLAEGMPELTQTNMFPSQNGKGVTQLGSDPTRDGGMGSLQSSLLQRRRNRSISEPAPIGRVV